MLRSGVGGRGAAVIMTTEDGPFDLRAALAQRAAQVGDVVNGRYVVRRTLGVGGMGVVVAATDNLLGREVALKFLLPHPAAAEQATSRLMREAQSIARIKTEHVVQLMDVGVFRGAPFLVMEHLAGEDLRRLVGRRGPLRLTVAVDYVMQALQAVAEAHMKGIVHRDLKASNLFVLQRPDGSPLIKVIDFGIAKSLGEEALTGVTQTGGGLLGSPSHLSPEQLKSPREVDARTDIWALGVTLFELLTNALPFPDDSCASLLAAISNEVPRTFREVGCDVPPAFQDVVSECLNKDRTRRVPSAFELAKRLAPFGSADAKLSLNRIEGIVKREAPTTERNLVPTSPQFADTEPARDAGTGNSWGNTTSEQRSLRLSRRIRTSGVLAAVGVASFAGVSYWLSAAGSSQTPPRTVATRIVPSSEPSARPSHVSVNANRTDTQQTPDMMPSGVPTSAPSVRVIGGTLAAKRAAAPSPLPSASTTLSSPASSVSVNVAGRRSIEDLIEERR
jgi:serine/threonine-protein kinase